MSWSAGKFGDGKIELVAPCPNMFIISNGLGVKDSVIHGCRESMEIN